MKGNGGNVGGRGSSSTREMDADEFARSLDRRREAANQLEKDLLTEVPLLYGQPGSAGNGGLARIRRDEMRRRSGDDMSKAYRTSSEALPFERAVAVLALLLFLFFLLAKLA